MTSGVELEQLTISFESDSRSLELDKGFDERFEKAAVALESFLKDPKRNKFTTKYQAQSHYSFNVCLCDDERMKELNGQFRGKEKTTDVLTLALYENIRGGEEQLFDEVELGDIFISVPVMKQQASEFKVTIEQEFFHLLVHGFLHLLGFDHELSQSEENLMEELEKGLVDTIYTSIY